jgi:hypothetical protein
MNILRYLKGLLKSTLRNISDVTDTISWHENAFHITLYMSYALYIIAFTGILSFNPQYLSTLETIIKYYIAIMLLIRFNPYVNRKITEFDKHLVFEAAMLLFISTTAYAIAKSYIGEITHIVHS